MWWGTNRFIFLFSLPSCAFENAYNKNLPIYTKTVSICTLLAFHFRSRFFFGFYFATKFALIPLCMSTVVSGVLETVEIQLEGLSETTVWWPQPHLPELIHRARGTQVHLAGGPSSTSWSKPGRQLGVVLWWFVKFMALLLLSTSRVFLLCLFSLAWLHPSWQFPTCLTSLQFY